MASTPKYAAGRKRKFYEEIASMYGGRKLGNSAWTQCKDTRVHDRRRKQLTRFERKVHRALGSTFQHQAQLAEYSFHLPFGPSNPRQTTIPHYCGWSQFAIDPCFWYTADGEGEYIQGAIDTSKVTGGPAAPTNPCGINTGILFVKDVSNGYQGTQLQTLTNLWSNQLGVDGSVGHKITRLEYRNRSFNFELRNPHSFGVRVFIYHVAPRIDVAVQATSAFGRFPGQGGGLAPTQWVANAYENTPLENFGAGLARKGLNPYDMVTSRHISPHDSPDFLDTYRIKSRCSLYMPPGGTAFKSFSRRMNRIVDSRDVTCFIQKRGLTEWVLFKVVPEAQLLPRNDNTGGTGPQIADTFVPGIPGYFPCTGGSVYPPTNYLAGGTSSGNVASLPNVGIYGTLMIRRKWTLWYANRNPDTLAINNTAPVGGIMWGGTTALYYGEEQEPVGGGKNDVDT